MSLSNDEIERLHRSGKMPDWVYYQLYTNNAQNSYSNQREKFMEQINQKKTEEEIEKQIDKKIEDAVEKAFTDISAVFCK